MRADFPIAITRKNLINYSTDPVPNFFLFTSQSNTRMKSQRLIFCMLLSVFCLFASAQSTSFSDVIKLEYRNAGQIYENDQIKGYYLFYLVDKVSKKEYSYRLQILDENMQEAVSTTIIRPKSYSLKEASFNGQAFLFHFYDEKQQAFELASFDRQAQEIGVKKYESMKNKEVNLYLTWKHGQRMDPAEEINVSLFPVGNRGFLRAFPINTGGNKSGMVIEYLSNDLASDGWTIRTPDKTVELKTVTSVSDNYATIISKPTYVNSPQQTSSPALAGMVELINVRNGKRVFKKQLAESKRLLVPQFWQYDAEKEEAILMGNYYNTSKKMSLLGQGKGFYVMTFSKTGEVKQKNFITWAEDFSKFVDVSDKGRMEEGGWVAVHDVVRTGNGHLYVIGEQFNKKVTAGSAGLTALGMVTQSGAISPSVVELGDMAIFDFGEDLELQDVQLVNKRHNKVHMPFGFGMMPRSMLIQMMKMFGYFDYAYTQMTEDRDRFYVAYFSTNEEKGKKNEPIFGAIVRDETGAFSTDEINLQSDASRMWVLPAKAGYVSIWEYFKKEKRLDVRLEQINY